MTRTDLIDQDFGDRDLGFLVPRMGEADRKLACADHLSGFDRRRQDDAFRIGPQDRIGRGILGQCHSALTPQQPAARLLGRGFLSIRCGCRRPSFPGQCRRPMEVGLGLRQRGRGSIALGRGLFALQLDVDLVEASQGLSRHYPVADVDQAGRDLAIDAEAEIGLDARPDRRNEVTFRDSVFERDALHEDRPAPIGHGGVASLLLATGKQGGRG